MHQRHANAPPHPPGLLPDGRAASLDAVPSSGWPADLHIIGKDILRFHAVYWPGMLIAAGLPPPRRVFGHGFLTKDGLKMGKSLGNVLEPTALLAAYGADAVRFYFMKEVSFGQDGDFSEERFRNIVNANLANDIGNLLNRTLNLLRKNCEATIPLDTAGIASTNPLRCADFQKYDVICSFALSSEISSVQIYAGYLHACIPAYLHTCIPAYLHTCIPAFMHTSLTPSPS
jgi:methionyl-tRNA synthetase